MGPDEKEDFFERLHDGFLRRWWVKYLLIPGIEAAPTAVAALYVGLGHTSFLAAGNFVGYNSAWLVLAASVLSGVLAAIRSAISEKGRQRISDLKNEIKRLFRLIGQVRTIVTTKSNRFQDTLKNMDVLQKAKDPVSAGDVFMAIIQPEEQIKEIIRGVHDYFSADTDPTVEEINVSVMKWNAARNHLEFIAYFPYHRRPRSPDADFCDTSTLAGRAYFDRDFVICENIRTDPRYKRLSDPVDEQGSMLAYSVYDEETQKVALVINVSSAKPRRFRNTEDEKRVLKIPMQIFAERLLLENRLVEIKAKVARV